MCVVYFAFCLGNTASVVVLFKGSPLLKHLNPLRPRNGAQKFLAIGTTSGMGKHLVYLMDVNIFGKPHEAGMWCKHSIRWHKISRGKQPQLVKILHGFVLDVPKLQP
eukprot:1147331-Pelagomonas_calceolata.AAC.3